MTSDEYIMDLVTKIDDLVEAHFAQRGDHTAFEALGALGYFTGVLLASAPDENVRAEAYNRFSQSFSEGLESQVTTKH